MEIDSSQLFIRKVGPEDISSLTEYRLAYLAELQGEQDEEYKNKLRQELEIYFSEAMKKNSFFALLAEYKNKAIAFGGMVITRIPGDFNQSSYIEGSILNMYTIPEARRKGVSSRILESLLQEAAKMGISKVALHTSKDGEQLYRKFGFMDPAYPVLEKIIRK